MSDDLNRILKKLEGDGPIEKHILLLKLTKALENAPEFGDKPVLDVGTPQRQWLAQVGALLSRLGLESKIEYQAAFRTLSQHWVPAIRQIKGQVADSIEMLRLELELVGRSEIGNAYAPGDVYRFFADLKAIIDSAQTEVIIIDPYFDGSAFDSYLAAARPELIIRILADRYAQDVHAYAERHRVQFKTNIELRKSSKLHDRLVFVDGDDCWIMGGSIKDAGKKATYLIPVGAPIATAKREIYEAIWADATPLQ